MTYGIDSFQYIEEINPEYDYDILYAHLDVFLTAYFDESIGNTDFINIYQYGYTTGEEYEFRLQDFSRIGSPEFIKFVIREPLVIGAQIDVVVFDQGYAMLSQVTFNGYTPEGIPKFYISNSLINTIKPVN